MAIYAAAVSRERSGKATGLVTEGLSKMSQPHDSWGIAYQMRFGGFRAERQVGALQLKSALGVPPSDIAIGHLKDSSIFRGPTLEMTAQPQTGCIMDKYGGYRLVVATMRDVRNSEDIRDMSPGHQLALSDAEAVACFLEVATEKQTEGLINVEDGYRNALWFMDGYFRAAALTSLPQLEGKNAIVAAHGETVIAANLGLPLTIGEGDGITLVSSNNRALRGFAEWGFINRALHVRTGEMAAIVNGSLTALFSLRDHSEIGPLADRLLPLDTE